MLQRPLRMWFNSEISVLGGGGITRWENQRTCRVIVSIYHTEVKCVANNSAPVYPSISHISSAFLYLPSFNFVTLRVLENLFAAWGAWNWWFRNLHEREKLDEEEIHEYLYTFLLKIFQRNAKCCEQNSLGRKNLRDGWDIEGSMRGMRSSYGGSIEKHWGFDYFSI